MVTFRETIMFVDSREQILASLSTVSNPYAGNPSHSYVCKIVIGGSEKNWTFWQDKSEIWHAVISFPTFENSNANYGCFNWKCSAAFEFILC